MKKEISVFDLYVITLCDKDQKFICKKNLKGLYIEYLTNTKLDQEKIIVVEPLTQYCSSMEIMNYKTHEPLMLTKEMVLTRCIEINISNELENKEEYKARKRNKHVDGGFKEIEIF